MPVEATSEENTSEEATSAKATSAEGGSSIAAHSMEHLLSGLHSRVAHQQDELNQHDG